MRHKTAFWAVLGTTGLGGVSAGVTTGSRPGSIPDSRQLYRSATLRVRHFHRKQRRFFSVVLRDPVGPRPTGPLYIFEFHKANRAVHIAVGARSGKISTLR